MDVQKYKTRFAVLEGEGYNLRVLVIQSKTDVD
jgi:hypothetical protein